MSSQSKKPRAQPGPKNALSHGLYARDVVLPWEKEEDFMELYQGIRAELRPSGTLQEQTALDIAVLHWKKQRLHIGTQLAYRGHPDAAAMATAGENGWEGIGRYLHETSGNPDRLSGEARTAAKAYAQAITMIAELTEKLLSRIKSGKNAARAPETLKELINVAKEVSVFGPQVTLQLKFAEDFDLQQGPYERAHRPDVMERYSKIEAHLDKRIDKAFTRMIHLKEYAKMYPEVPTIAAPAADLAPSSSPALAPESSEEPQQSE